MNIQIVVPVYNAYPVFSDALSALKSHNLNDDVLFINDASTDQRISKLLGDVPECWRVIENHQNLGFVKTANIGLRNTTGHSILLNSDAVVTANWLARFEQAIEADSDIGTATPWSNNAEICSLPKTLQPNSLPNDINQLAHELFTRHQPCYPELPTAVGFCMLITARAKKQVGYFDEATFGIGYGEENDYSMRVRMQNLKNILVDNCYVVHVGNQSFQEVGLKPNEKTMLRLLKKHPAYMQLIQKFIEKDPLAALRASIIAKISAF